MRVLIVEDSAGDRLGLRTLLARCPGISAISEAGDVAAARKILTGHTLDVLFLDVELGHETGFDLIHSMEKMPCVVLTTVHPHLSDQAFDVGVVDYIVKPITEERLLRSLQRVSVRLGTEAAMLTRVAVHRSGSARRFAALETIAAVLADGNYSRVFCDSMEIPDHRSLREWETLLNGRGFERLDRSTLLRPDLVCSWLPFGKGARVAFLHSSAVAEVGRTAFQRLEAIFASRHQPANGGQPRSVGPAGGVP